MYIYIYAYIVTTYDRNIATCCLHSEDTDTQTLKEETRGNVVLNQGNVRIPAATPMADKQNGQRLFEKT